MNVRETWTKVFNAFDPRQAPWDEQAAQWYVERSDRPLIRLAERLASSSLPVKAIVTGHRGSGKSWALAHLVRTPQFADRFLVVWLDVEHSADIFNVNHVEILFLMGVAAFKAAQDLRLQPDRKYLDGVMDSLTTLVREETGNNRFAINLDEVLNAVIAIGLGAIGAGATTLGAAIAGAGGPVQRASLHPGHQQRNGAPDRGPAAHYRNCESAERPAGRNPPPRPSPSPAGGGRAGQNRTGPGPGPSSPRAEFSRSRHAISSTRPPILLYYSPDFASARQLFAAYEFPNVRLFHRESRERRDEQGYAFMREVVRTRLEKLGLDPDELVDPAALDELVAMSGGVVRELVLLMQEAAIEAMVNGRDHIDLTIARKVIYWLRRQYSAALSLPYLEELKKVHETGRPTGTEICDKLLQNLYILSYANDDLWYAVHPNVLPLLEGA